MRTSRVALVLLTLACSGKGPVDPPDEQPPANQPIPPRSVFPSDNAWNRDISAEQVDPNSANLIASCGATRSLHPDFGTTYEGVPWGIPFVTVRGDQARVPVSFD